jgi:cation diffusion facilitator family transporter
MASASSSKFVIYAALAGNLLVALTKFTAAAWTGSSAMLSEGVHSLVDTMNQVLMLYGIHRASAPPDAQHPLGYGRELYFWSFVVALLIFALGAGVAFYEGIAHIRAPVTIEDSTINYIVLALSFVFESVSWWIAVRAFEKHRGTLGYIEAATRSRDPTSYLVLFEDTAALMGIVVAFIGIAAADYFGMPELDGVASIGIGMILATTALFLARESKGLLIGEPAQESTRRSIAYLVRNTPGVIDIARLITVHLAPLQIVAALDVDFADDLRTSEVERVASAIENAIKSKHPEVVAVFLSPRNAVPAALATPKQQKS